MRCLAGARACPPEDGGGAWGCAELAEVVADPKHERTAELTEWLGDEFDPEHFNPAETNVLLGCLPV
ncbi:MAG: IS1096 element passenger TnpR family protein [Verrucomicrobiota bacterium]